MRRLPIERYEIEKMAGTLYRGCSNGSYCANVVTIEDHVHIRIPSIYEVQQADDALC